jgi:hypothetical protein
MQLDSQLNFVPVGGPPLSFVGALGAGFPAPNVIDILGSGVGTAPQNVIGNRVLFGEDPSIGGIKIQIEAAIGVAAVTITAATLNMQFQGAPDTGVGGGYLPGAWTTYEETGPITAANLVAGQTIRMDWAAVFPEGQPLPRYIRINFATPAATQFTVGNVSYVITTMVRDDQTNKFAAKNYTV